MPNGYSTNQELEFLLNYGCHNRMPQQHRNNFYERYLSGCLIRYDWGAVKPHRIIQYLVSEIGLPRARRVAKKRGMLRELMFYLTKIP